MSEPRPRVTVLMPVHNAAPYLREAMQSILCQSLCDFEFLVIDDGSTDGSQDIVRRCSDTRIRFVRNERNLGVARTLNRGLDMARGDYVARMDADDISLPERLARQVEFLDRNRGVGIVGGWARLLGEHDGMLDRRPVGPDLLKAHLFFDNPLIHPTVMMRRAVLDEQALRYDSAFSRSEDYDLWRRASTKTRLDNLPEILIRFRVHRQRVTSLNGDEMESQSRILLQRLLLELQIEPDEASLRLHRRVGHGMSLTSRDEVDRAECWLNKLVEANGRVGCVAPLAFLEAVRDVWFKTCANSGALGPWLLRRYRRSSLSAWSSRTVRDRARFTLAVLYHVVRRAKSASI